MQLPAHDVDHFPEIRAQRAKDIETLGVKRNRDASAYASRLEGIVQPRQDVLLVTVRDLRSAGLELVELAVRVDLVHGGAVRDVVAFPRDLHCHGILQLLLSGLERCLFFQSEHLGLALLVLFRLVLKPVRQRCWQQQAQVVAMAVQHVAIRQAALRFDGH
jgi:hypothetical protein